MPDRLPPPQHIALGLSLLDEAKQGWWHEVTRRMRSGEDVQVRDPGGIGLLHLASRAGRRRLVEELMSLGAAPNARDARGRTPLLYCAESGSPEVAETLAATAKPSEAAGGSDDPFDVNAQDDTGATALAIAARHGHLRLVRWLLARRDLQPNTRDHYGVSALHKCVHTPRATRPGSTACGSHSCL